MNSIGRIAGALLFVHSTVFAVPFAYVTNSGDDTVTVIDTATNAVAYSLPVGHFPYGVAVHPDETFVYVTNKADASLSVIDTSKRRVIDTIPGLGHAVAISPDGSAAYVSGLVDGHVVLARIDTTSNTIAKVVDLGEGGTGDEELGIAADDSNAYIATTLHDPERFPCHQTILGCRLIVHVVDADGNDTPRFIGDPLGYPKGIALGNRSRRLFVAGNIGQAGLVTIDLTQAGIVGFVPLGVSFGVAVSPTDGRVYATSNIGLAIISPSSLDPPRSIELGNGPRGVAVTPDGARTFVVNHESDDVSVVDNATLTVIDTIPVGRAPVAFGQFIAAAVASACVGDCDGNGTVTIDEVIKAVTIALGDQAVSTCLAADSDRSGTVTIDEVVTGITMIFEGCGD